MRRFLAHLFAFRHARHVPAPRFPLRPTGTVRLVARGPYDWAADR